MFSLEPHIPQGRNPVRGSEFHENEPQSLHGLIQISQLHISESFPNLSHPSKPQAQVPTLCPPLLFLARNLRRLYRGAHCIQANPQVDIEGGFQAQSGRTEFEVRRWFFPHSTSLPSAPGQLTQGVWLQGDFEIPQTVPKEGGRELCSG